MASFLVEVCGSSSSGGKIAGRRRSKERLAAVVRGPTKKPSSTHPIGSPSFRIVSLILASMSAWAYARVEETGNVNGPGGFGCREGLQRALNVLETFHWKRAAQISTN